MSPTFDFLVKIDKIYVTSRHFREILGTLPAKTSDKQDKSDALAETLEGLTTNDAGYYESDSVTVNDAKDNPASYLKIAIQNSDRNKRKLMDTRKRDLQQKILSNRTLPIITTAIDPQIDNRVAISGASLHKLAMAHTMEVIMDAARSSAQILWTPRIIIRTGWDGTAPGD